MSRLRLALVALVAVYLALALPAIGRRGAAAEEVQPYLPRYPVVLEWRGDDVAPMPPYEPGGAPPRWVSTSQWPVVGYDGATRLWPVLVRGHQSALGSYVGIGLAPLLGGGVAGVRRSTALLGLVIVLLTVATGRRLGLSRAASVGAGLLLATSAGALVMARGAFGFEVVSRVFAMITIFVAARAAPPSPARSALIGVLAGLALASRATVVTVLAPALAALLLVGARAPGALAGAALGALAVGVPAGVLTFAELVTPLRVDAAPLAGFPFGALAERTLGAPRQLLLQLAWTGHAPAILAPLHGGAPSLGALGPAALVGGVPLVAAIVRLARGRATEAERLFAWAAITSALLGAWLYAGPNEFQLALALEPLHALAVAAQLGALRRRGAAIAVGGALVVLHLAGVATSWHAEAHERNPMLSGATQRGAVARLRALGASGPEVLTTTYNQAGVLEAWSEGELRPRHAWPLLRSSEDARLDRAWARLLDGPGAPRWILLSPGTNLYEGAGIDPPRIARSLGRVAAARGLALTPDGDFPTEAGAPGWSLVRVTPRAP